MIIALLIIFVRSFLVYFLVLSIRRFQTFPPYKRVTHLWPFSKSKFNLAPSTLLHRLVILSVFFIYPMSGRYSTNWDRKGWPGIGNSNVLRLPVVYTLYIEVKLIRFGFSLTPFSYSQTLHFKNPYNIRFRTVFGINQ